MNDNEIRLKIAELKGWYLGDNKQAGLDHYDRSGEIPRWPTNIAAAWELVEDAISSGCQVSVSYPNWTDRGDPIPGFWARFEIPPSDDSFYNCAYDGEADTAARAICLAWLKWKGVEVETTIPNQF